MKHIIRHLGRRGFMAERGGGHNSFTLMKAEALVFATRESALTRIEEEKQAGTAHATQLMVEPLEGANANG